MYIGKNTDLQLVQSGKIEVFRLGNWWRVMRISVEKYIMLYSSLGIDKIVEPFDKNPSKRFPSNYLSVNNKQSILLRKQQIRGQIILGFLGFDVCSIT